MIPVDLWTAFGRFGMLVVHRKHTIQSYLLATYEGEIGIWISASFLACTTDGWYGFKEP